MLVGNSHDMPGEVLRYDMKCIEHLFKFYLQYISRTKNVEAMFYILSLPLSVQYVVHMTNKLMYHILGYNHDSALYDDKPLVSGAR